MSTNFLGYVYSEHDTTMHFSLQKFSHKSRIGRVSRQYEYVDVDWELIARWTSSHKMYIHKAFPQCVPVDADTRLMGH